MLNDLKITELSRVTLEFRYILSFFSVISLIDLIITPSPFATKQLFLISLYTKKPIFINCY